MSAYEVGSCGPVHFADKPEANSAPQPTEADWKWMERTFTAPVEGLQVADCLRLLDAAKLTIAASWRAGNQCDGSTIQAAIKLLEQLERRLGAHR